MNQLQRVATTAMVILAVMASADETIAPVPQGSRAFPTLGQVNCMEEAGSGRLCATTYECQDGWYEGVLWGDMAFHNGRRSLGPDSPIARQRDCTITVDGKASVQWFAGFTPGGPDSAAVGVTDRGEARTPVLRREITTLGGSTEGGTLLEWLYENHDVHPDDIVNEKCGGSWDDDTNGHGDPCWFGALRELGQLISAEANPLTQCSAELTKRVQGTGDELLFASPLSALGHARFRHEASLRLGLFYGGEEYPQLSKA